MEVYKSVEGTGDAVKHVNLWTYLVCIIQYAARTPKTAPEAPKLVMVSCPRNVQYANGANEASNPLAMYIARKVPRPTSSCKVAAIGMKTRNPMLTARWSTCWWL